MLKTIVGLWQRAVNKQRKPKNESKDSQGKNWSRGQGAQDARVAVRWAWIDDWHDSSELEPRRDSTLCTPVSME
jgi:hypothetical protein